MKPCAHVSTLAIAASLLACTAEPHKPPATPAESPSRRAEPPPAVEGEIGGLPEEAMERALTALGRDVVDCVMKRSGDIEALGGHMKLSLRVSRDGSTKWAFLRESTMGDRETERCVIDLAMAKTWPKPVGGEGLAEKAFDVDPQLVPASVEEKRVRRALDEARREAARCRKGTRGTFFATAYLRSNGKVAAAGAAPPKENAEEVVDCIVDAVMRLQFGKLGGKMSKLSFEIP